MQKAAKVQAGLAAIDAEEQQYIDEGGITREAADVVAEKIKKEHPVFTSLTVVDGSDSWDYDYTASPGKKKAGEKKAKGDGVVDLTVVGQTSRSAVGDVGFADMTAHQKKDPTAPRQAELQVGANLETATGAAAQEGGLPTLSTKGQVTRGAPAASTVLLEQPIVTGKDHPSATGSRAPLGSAQPDFLVLTPDQVEVFEVTLDATFSIKPAEAGMRIKKGGKKAGDPHKQIQIEKTVIYLAERFPHAPIVYNIQTKGELPKELRTLLETELLRIGRALKSRKLRNPVQIVWRG